jgi:hypothetical protein
MPWIYNEKIGGERVKKNCDQELKKIKGIIETCMTKQIDLQMYPIAIIDSMTRMHLEIECYQKNRLKLQESKCQN